MVKHPDETLDVVDEENVVVGQAGRQEVHDKSLLHRSVHLILVSQKGHFLLQKRPSTAPTYPGRWDSSAAGHVLAGATFDETVEREAIEEIGYKPEDAVPVLLIEGSAETDYEWVQFYSEKLEMPPRLQADPLEIAELRWWSEAEIVAAIAEDRELFTPVFVILFSLWRLTGFLVPERQEGEWYDIATGNAHELQVRRAFLESAEIPARVAEDQHWLAPHGGRAVFGARREARHTVLSVPRDLLPDAIALLYLSSPAEDYAE